MKTLKRWMSFVLTFAMVFTTVCCAVPVTSFADSGDGPELIGYSVEPEAEKPEAEYDSEIFVTLKFDREMDTDRWTKNAFDILINNRTPQDMGFEVADVTAEGRNLVIDLKGIDAGEDSWCYVITGTLNISLKSNYYEDIIDTDGNQVSFWTDINTMIPTGLEFEQVEDKTVAGDEETPASVTFKLTGDVKLRGMSPVQILVGGNSIVRNEGQCNALRGTVNVHTHMYLTGSNSNWAAALARNFRSDSYTMTAEEDEITLTAVENGENTDLTENTVIRAFACDGENDSVVQPYLFKEDIAAARTRLEEIDRTKVSEAAKEALSEAIEDAEDVDLTDENITAIEWQKYRNALKSAMKGAGDNAIITTEAKRSDGNVVLKLQGSSDWADDITSVSVDGTAIDDSRYDVDPDALTVKIKSGAFDKEGEITPKTKTYTVSIESDDYAAVSQDVTLTYMGADSFQLRYFDRNGNLKVSKTYSREMLEEMAEDTDVYYNTACQMTGLRTFKGQGVYLEDLVADMGLTVDTTAAVTVKVRTNDSLEGEENDSTTEDGYYERATTSYANLMQPRYWFPSLFEDSELKTTVLGSRGISDEVRAALGADQSKEAVKPMIALQYAETVYARSQESPEGLGYDEDLNRDMGLRLLFGTAMTEEEGQTVASKETTTWMAAYQTFGIDLIDGGTKTTFKLDPENLKLEIKDAEGNAVEPDQDGTYTFDSAETYTYTASAEGYVTKTEEFIPAETISIKLEKKDSKPSNGGGSSGGRSSGGISGSTPAAGNTTPANPENPAVIIQDPQTPASETTNQGGSSAVKFADVDSSAWYAQYVMNLYAKGLINGKAEGVFDPLGKLTRAEFIKILALASGDALTDTTVSFSDVKESDWFAPYVAWGVKNGIINGVSDNRFAPDEYVSRQDMAVMIVRYAEKKGIILGQAAEKIDFSDRNSIAEYAAAAVETIQKAGLMSGREDGSFDPRGLTTRAEFCKVESMFLTYM
ncbi:MAG: S-layer homology domain-containing protein [Clostridia bacterium]|nr:S-layer homology domain-containing protein [Clostridia bacterium]